MYNYAGFACTELTSCDLESDIFTVRFKKVFTFLLTASNNDKLKKLQPVSFYYEMYDNSVRSQDHCPSLLFHDCHHTKNGAAHTTLVTRKRIIKKWALLLIKQ